MADQAVLFPRFGGVVQGQTLDARANNDRGPDLVCVLLLVVGSDSEPFLERASERDKDLSQLEMGRNSARALF